MNEQKCNKCAFWTENDPRCMCDESPWGGLTVKADHCCSKYEKWPTVADHIRDMLKMNDEQLADKIIEVLPMLYGTGLDPSGKFCDDQGGCTAEGECCDEYRRECILRWLRGAWQDE